jgi:hypothetical protein
MNTLEISPTATLLIATVAQPFHGPDVASSNGSRCDEIKPQYECDHESHLIRNAQGGRGSVTAQEIRVTMLKQCLQVLETVYVIEDARPIKE